MVRKNKKAAKFNSYFLRYRMGPPIHRIKAFIPNIYIVAFGGQKRLRIRLFLCLFTEIYYN